MPGLVRALVVAVVVALWGGAANAQVFRPRGKTPSTKPAAKAAAPSKQPTRAAGPTPRRVVVTKPESDVKAAPAPSKAKGKGKSKGKEDIVIVDDDDDDDVKIKDE